MLKNTNRYIKRRAAHLLDKTLSHRNERLIEITDRKLHNYSVITDVGVCNTNNLSQNNKFVSQIIINFTSYSTFSGTSSFTSVFPPICSSRFVFFSCLTF